MVRKWLLRLVFVEVTRPVSHLLAGTIAAKSMIRVSTTLVRMNPLRTKLVQQAAHKPKTLRTIKSSG